MKLSRQLLKINPSGGTDLKTLYLQSLKVTVIIYADNWRPCKTVEVINSEDHKEADGKVTTEAQHVSERRSPPRRRSHPPTMPLTRTPDPGHPWGDRGPGSRRNQLGYHLSRVLMQEK